MKIKAIFGVELNGHIYHRGDVADYDGEVTSRIADNFTDLDGNSLTQLGQIAAAIPETTTGDDKESIVEKTIASLKREGIKRALDRMNVTYPNKAGTEYLAKLLLVNRGELETI